MACLRGVSVYTNGHYRLTINPACIQYGIANVQGGPCIAPSKLLRIFKVVRYFEPLMVIVAVIRKQGKILWTVASLALFYIFITALIMFNAEEEINPVNGQPLFRDFFDAFYWAACTLTTVGYGDLYPISNTGRVISILSSIVGIAIIALPSGIITAGYMDELKLRKELKEREENAPLASAE